MGINLWIDVLKRPAPVTLYLPSLSLSPDSWHMVHDNHLMFSIHTIDELRGGPRCFNLCLKVALNSIMWMLHTPLQCGRTDKSAEVCLSYLDNCRIYLAFVVCMSHFFFFFIEFVMFVWSFLCSPCPVSSLPSFVIVCPTLMGFTCVLLISPASCIEACLLPSAFVRSLHACGLCVPSSLCFFTVCLTFLHCSLFVDLDGVFCFWPSPLFQQAESLINKAFIWEAALPAVFAQVQTPLCPRLFPKILRVMLGPASLKQR